MSETPKRTKEFTFAGMAAVVSSNIGWGLTDIFIKIIGRGQVSVWIYALTGSIFLLGLMVASKEKLRWKDFVKSFPIGLQRAIVWSALFIAFQEDNPAIGITVLSFSLVVSIVVFGPRLGEKLTPTILVLSGVGVIGLILTSVQSFADAQMSRGAVLALLVLPVASAGTYILRNVLEEVPHKPTALYMHVWVAILFSFIIPLINPEFNFSRNEIYVIIALAVIGAGGHYLFNYSQAHTTFRFNAIASTVHTPAVAIFAWMILGDTLLFHQIIGMVIVMAVVGYLAVTTRKPEIQELDENLVVGP